MELEEEEVSLIKEEISEKSKKTVRTNLLIIVGFVVVFFIFQLAKGKIDLDNLDGRKYLPEDYKGKPFMENLFEKINNVKDYLIFLLILFVFFLIIHKSNLDWEREVVKKYKFNKDDTYVLKENDKINKGNLKLD